jgi:membrane AbrB-like protein
MLNRFRTSLADFGAHAAGLLLAFAGGALFAWIGIPAAWLSGAMLASAVGGALRLFPPMVGPLRDASMLIAGVSLGMGVTPEALEALRAYPVSLALLVVGMMSIMATCTFVLVRFAGWPVRESFFASAPGALTAVMITAAEVRADVGRIAILQVSRLFVLVMVLPTAITMLEPPQPATAATHLVISPVGLAITFAASMLAAGLLHRLRVAAPLVMGAMAASAMLAATGEIVGTLPSVMSNAGFVVIGAFIGQRFRDIDFASLVRVLPAIGLSMASTLTVAGLFAAAVTLLTDIPIGAAVVAFSPGGLEAMTILALALGQDPLYVSVHHLARFVLIGLLVPVAMALWPQLGRGKSASGQ